MDDEPVSEFLQAAMLAKSGDRPAGTSPEEYEGYRIARVKSLAGQLYSPIRRIAASHIHEHLDVLTKLFINACLATTSLKWDSVEYGEVEGIDQITARAAYWRDTDVAWRDFNHQALSKELKTADEKTKTTIEEHLAITERGTAVLMHLEGVACYLFDFAGDLRRQWVSYRRPTEKDTLYFPIRTNIVFPPVIHERKFTQPEEFDIFERPLPVWILKQWPGSEEYVIDLTPLLMGLPAQALPLEEYNKNLGHPNSPCQWADLRSDFPDLYRFQKKHLHFGGGSRKPETYTPGKWVGSQYLAAKDASHHALLEWLFDIRPVKYFREFEIIDFFWSAFHRQFLLIETMWMLGHYCHSPSWSKDRDHHKTCGCKDSHRNENSSKYKDPVAFLANRVVESAKLHVDILTDSIWSTRRILAEQRTNAAPMSDLTSDEQYKEIVAALKSTDYYAQVAFTGPAHASHPSLRPSKPFKINATECIALLVLASCRVMAGREVGALPAFPAAHWRGGGPVSCRELRETFDRFLRCLVDLRKEQAFERLGALTVAVEPFAGACVPDLMKLLTGCSGQEMKTRHAAKVESLLISEQRWSAKTEKEGEDRAAAMEKVRKLRDARVREDSLASSPELVARAMIKPDYPVEESILKSMTFWKIGGVVVGGSAGVEGMVKEAAEFFKRGRRWE